MVNYWYWAKGIDSERSIELARFQLPDLNYPCWAAPVLSDGKLYLRSEKRLICLDVTESDRVKQSGAP